MDERGNCDVKEYDRFWPLRNYDRGIQDFSGNESGEPPLSGSEY